MTPRETEILSITRSETGDVEVWQDGRTTGPLTMGEVIQQALLMKTPEEWEEWAENLNSRRKTDTENNQP